MSNYKKFIGSGMSDEDQHLLEQIKPLVAEDVGRPTIMKVFGIGESKARRLIDIAKRELIDSEEAEHEIVPIVETKPPRRSTRINKIDEVRGLLDQGFDSYEIAKLKQTTPITTVRLVKQAEGTYNPTKDWIVKAAARGIKLSELEAKAGIKGLKRAKQVITENFPNCFVVETGKDKDFLVPIYDSAKDFEDLKIPSEDKRFKYHVSMEEDYLYVKFDDDIEADSIEIYNISDIHKGALGFREELFETYIELIASKPNAFALVGGDLIEALTKVSVGDPLDAYMSNTAQVKGVIQALKPIAHKILDWVYSNHDDGRTEKTAQVRLGELMATWLGVPFFRQGTVIDLSWRGVNKTIHHTHEYGNTFEESKIILETKKIRSYSNFEINAFLSGHVHRAVVRREELDDKVEGRGLKAGCYWVLVSGSTLARKRTYAQRAGYAPTPQDLTYYCFDDTGRDWGSKIEAHSL